MKTSKFKFPHMKFRGRIKEILTTPETVMITLTTRAGIFFRFFIDETTAASLAVGDKVRVTGSFLRMIHTVFPGDKHRTVFLIKSDSFTKI